MCLRNVIELGFVDHFDGDLFTREYVTRQFNDGKMSRPQCLFEIVKACNCVCYCATITIEMTLLVKISRRKILKVIFTHMFDVYQMMKRFFFKVPVVSSSDAASSLFKCINCFCLNKNINIICVYTAAAAVRLMMMISRIYDNFYCKWMNQIEINHIN